MQNMQSGGGARTGIEKLCIKQLDRADMTPPAHLLRPITFLLHFFPTEPENKQLPVGPVSEHTGGVCSHAHSARTGNGRLPISHLYLIRYRWERRTIQIQYNYIKNRSPHIWSESEYSLLSKAAYCRGTYASYYIILKYFMYYHFIYLYTVQ